MNGAEADFIFAVKGVMKDSPYIFLGLSLLVSVALPGFLIHIFEKPLIPYSGQDFNSISNCFWLIVITQTTVGYGDFFPVSNMGRIIGVVTSFWGVFIVSMFVVTLTNTLAFNEGEEKSYLILFRLNFKKDL